MTTSSDSSGRPGTETGTATRGASNSASPRSSADHFQFALADAGDPPDPRTHAWRDDLADVALAGQVISPHYAAPVARQLTKSTLLRVAPDGDAETIGELVEGAPFALLDSRGNWAWGYGGTDRLVGYVPVDVLA